MEGQLIKWGTCVAIAAMIMGCSTQKMVTKEVPVTVERVRRDTVAVTRWRTDTCIMRDSVVVTQTGTDRWRTRYVMRTRTDTVYKTRTDSVPKVVTVTKETVKEKEWPLKACLVFTAGCVAVIAIAAWRKE